MLIAPRSLPLILSLSLISREGVRGRGRETKQYTERERAKKEREEAAEFGRSAAPE